MIFCTYNDISFIMIILCGPNQYIFAHIVIFLMINKKRIKFQHSYPPPSTLTTTWNVFREKQSMILLHLIPQIMKKEMKKMMRQKLRMMYSVNYIWSVLWTIVWDMLKLADMRTMKLLGKLKNKIQNKPTVEGMNKKQKKVCNFPRLTTTVKMIGKFYSHG